MNLHQLLALLLAGGNQNQFSNEQQNPLIALLSGNQQQEPTQHEFTSITCTTIGRW